MAKQLPIITIIALIFFGLGFVAATKIPIGHSNTFQAGWEAAKQRLIDVGFLGLGEGVEITSVNGEVQQIQDNKINLKINPLEPLAEPELDNRVVEIDGNTKIYQLTEKSQGQFQKEMGEFNRKIQAQIANPETVTESINPPEPFNKEEISLADVRIGDRITAVAQENIKETKQFKATEITVQFRPVVETTSQ